MRNMRMDVYDKEVFVFTPKGDLYNLPLGATLLDFAFLIHTNIGSHCTGGRKRQESENQLQACQWRHCRNSHITPTAAQAGLARHL